MTAALGALVGAFLTFVVVLVELPPPPEAMVREAVALVPPDAELLEAGATGSTVDALRHLPSRPATTSGTSADYGSGDRPG